MTYPIRHRNHILETLSDNYIRTKIPAEWVLNQFHVDYGTDYNCETSNEGKVYGINFTIQLKSKEEETNSEFIVISKIKRSTINRWLNRLEPTMIIAFINNEKEAYWMWFEENSVNLTKKNKEFQLKIPRSNKISKIKWSEVSKKLEEIFSKRHMLYEAPYETLDLREKATWNNFFNKDYEKALLGLKEVIKTNKSPLLLNAIAVCHYELFHLQEALISTSTALETLKDDQLLWLNKAAILTEMGISNNDEKKLKTALNIYEDLIIKENNSADLYYNYANALNAYGLKKESQRAFQKCLKINPNKAEAWKNLGSLFHDFGLYDKELECYECALRINPNLQEAIFSKGITLLKVYNNVDEALELMLKSVSISDKFELQFPQAFFWIAEAYLLLNKLEEALAYNKKSLNIIPDDHYFLLQLERINNSR